MTTSRDIPGNRTPEVFRALAHLRAGVAAVDGLLRGTGPTPTPPLLTMALTDSSQATHHALMRLAEARELLAAGHDGRLESRGADMSTIAPSRVEAEVTCHSLLLALVATQLRTAWHARVLDAESAMRCLDSVVRTVCEVRTSRFTAQPDAFATEAELDGHARRGRPYVAGVGRERPGEWRAGESRPAGNERSTACQ
jgi:hypothetical protein